MGNLKNRYIFLLFSFVIFVCTPLVNAGTDIPESLKNWVPWVLHNQEERQCTASFSGGQRFCVWPEPLQMSISATGGSFQQRWVMEKGGWIILPGNEKHWPQDVSVNNSPALVVNRTGQPALYVDSPGSYLIKGAFFWKSLPDSMVIPSGTGFVFPFTLNGKEQTANITANTLWLAQKTTGKKEEKDVVQTDVYRLITDSIPMIITTNIKVRISGKPREIIIDWQLPENQIPIDLQSSLPVKIGSDNRIHMQARPGSYTIIYKSKITTPVDKLQLQASAAGPQKEYWSFQAQNNLRMVKITGVSAIDPGQTSIPGEWQSLPAYLVKKGDSMVFETIKRGDTEPAPNKLRLKRTLWLDSNGTGFTVQDFLTGVIHKDPRLEMQAPGQLGRMTIYGKDQLITKTDSGRDGVEVRQGTINAQAVSRIEGTRVFPAGGWGQTMENLHVDLILQPGWKLFYATGMDSTRSWVDRWTLLDCFIVLIIIIATFKTLGFFPAIVAAIAVTLSYHDHDAPRYIWLGVLACIAILKAVPHLKQIQIVTTVKLFLSIVLIVIILPYSVSELRKGIYPQLERSHSAHMTNKQAYQIQTQQIDEDKIEMETEYAGRAVGLNKSARKILPYAAPVSSGIGHREPMIQQLDTNSKVQAGPGVPNREWRKIGINWNGPVDPSVNLKLYLLTPLMNMLVIFIKTAAILVLAFFMFRYQAPKADNTKTVKKEELYEDESACNLAGDSGVGRGEKTLASLILLLTLFVFVSTGHCKDYPSPALLQQLQDRLLEPDKCYPNCADLNTMDIGLQGNTISIKIKAHSLNESAVPLPTGKGVYWKSITLNSALKPVFLNDESLWIKIPRGENIIAMTGQAVKNDFQFKLPVKPHFVRFNGGDSWTIAGVDPNGVPAGQLQFVKQEKQDSQEFGESTLPPSLRIERTLNLGIEWYVTSAVVRTSPRGKSVYLKIPLLPGESVTDARYKVKDGHIEINMGPDARKVEWTSVLKKTSALTLKAPDTTKWNEIWRLNASPVWHIENTGTPVIQFYAANKAWQPEWHPWPGEQVELTITRPPGVEGSTKTIDSSTLEISPGLRSTSLKLSLVIRSTRGDQQQIVLPPDFILQSVTVNGQQQPIKNDNTVIVPLVPSSQTIEISMNSPQRISTLFKTPEINLGMDSVNSEIVIQSGSRWIWFVKGPQNGPAVLFYSELIIILLAAIILGISGYTPLSALQWIVLGLGLSQSGLIPCGVIVAWFIALQLRKTRASMLKGGAFNVYQVFLVILTVLSCAAIVYAVQHGLLGHPDMNIAGNGSNSYHLRWYQDHVSAVLPQPLVVSFPIMVYRAAMLIWALWLAFNMLSWVKWGWECLTTEKGWEAVQLRRKNKKQSQEKV